jgi:hypothetical protein
MALPYTLYQHARKTRERGGKLASFGTAIWAKAVQHLDIRPIHAFYSSSSSSLFYFN